MFCAGIRQSAEEELEESIRINLPRNLDVGNKFLAEYKRIGRF